MGRRVTLPDRIRIGEAVYLPAGDRLLSASGEDILLRKQSADVLQVLARNIGGLVPRDDLVEAVWGDLAVTDDSLTQCIADIRRALGDEDRSILKTVRRRGYILSGEVLAPDLTALGRTAVARPASVQAAAEPAPRFAPMPDPGAEDVAPLKAELDPRDVLPTLAVLPMRRLTAAAPDPLGLFLAEELSSALSRSQDLNVISRLSTERFVQPGADHKDLRTALNADFVLSGVLMSDDTSGVVSLEFADTGSNYILWSDRLRIPISPLMTDNEWVGPVIAKIRNAITINEVARLKSGNLADLQLFSVLHGAIGLMHRLSPADFNEARALLVQLAETVPKSPVPWAWLARWHVLRSAQGWTENPQKEAEDALGHTARALDLDPTNTLALVCEGQVLTHMARRLDEAAERYEIALAHNPNDAHGLAQRGVLEGFRDNGEEGKRGTERALHLSPLDPHRFLYLVFASGANVAAGDYQRAEALAKESLRLNRTHVSTLRILTVAQAAQDRIDLARKTAKDLMALQPGLRVSQWLRNAPSADFEIGRRFAGYLRKAGVPD